MFANLKIGVKIGIGYALIVIVLIGAVVSTSWQVERTSRIVSHLMDVRTPLVQETLILSRGVNRSFAALRGWIILGENTFKQERATIWSDEIDDSLTHLKLLSEKWMDRDYTDRLNKIESLLTELKTYQQEIEEIAQTIDNTPATKLLLEEGIPLSEMMESNLTGMIEIERKLEADAQRKNLLSLMADSRGSLALASANIRAYLISGDDKYKARFEWLWKDNVKFVENLKSNLKLMTPEQQSLLESLVQSQEKLSPILVKILQIRTGSEWNLAHAWLGEKIVPIAAVINAELDGIIDTQKKQMNQEQIHIKEQTSRLKLLGWMLLGVGLIFSVGAGVVITRSVTRPLKTAVAAADRLAQGDLTIQFDDRLTEDETGMLLNSMKRMAGAMQQMVKEISDSTDRLTASSEELAAISSQMASSAEETDAQATSVASSSEQISTSIGMVASAAEQSSTAIIGIATMTEEMSATFNNIAEFAKRTYQNTEQMAKSSDQLSESITSVASASEEMTASLNEVAKHTVQASRISGDANRRAEEINAKMNALVSASKQIGRVMSVIKDIADQTNMLALNAAIEAAGAGEAGKGFAVVAGEVKELAKQSADATDEIAGQIEQIQTSTNEAFEAIAEISRLISDIAGINESIAASAEEQTSTANEISKSIANSAAMIRGIAKNATESAELVKEIAKSTDETAKTASGVSRHVDELAKGAKEIARSSMEASRGAQNISNSMQQISIASKETSGGAAQTSASSAELSKMALALSEMVRRFKL